MESQTKSQFCTVMFQQSWKFNEHSRLFFLIRQIPVLLSNDEYDIIKKIISKSVNFAEPVLYI